MTLLALLSGPAAADLHDAVMSGDLDADTSRAVSSEDRGARLIEFVFRNPAA